MRQSAFLFVKSRFIRVLAALPAAALLFLVGFAGTSPTTVTVSDAGELTAELNAADSESGSVVISYVSGVSNIELSDSASVPSNVVLDLSGGNTLRITGGVFSVNGTISGGGVEVAGGTLVRQSGCSITSSLTVSGSGTVRGARVLTLENLSASSSENIVSVSYEGETSADTSSFVTRAANGWIYQKMTGGSYSSYKVITEVITDAGHVFRLGTKNADVLSLEYVLAYGNLTGATLAADNPTSYTASDAAITLTNPAKEGFRFDGWTCAQLGVNVPAPSMTIPEGTTGALTFIANWTAMPAGGGMSGGGGSLSSAQSGTEATPSPDAAATPAPTTGTATTATQRIGRGKSSTKVTFTSDVDAVEPTLESLQKKSFPWGWTLGGVGAAAVAIYTVSWIVRKRRENK